MPEGVPSPAAGTQQGRGLRAAPACRCKAKHGVYRTQEAGGCAADWEAATGKAAHVSSDSDMRVRRRWERLAPGKGGQRPSARNARGLRSSSVKEKAAPEPAHDGPASLPGRDTPAAHWGCVCRSGTSYSAHRHPSPFRGSQPPAGGSGLDPIATVQIKLAALGWQGAFFPWEVATSARRWCQARVGNVSLPDDFRGVWG
jgi:hypothetical protein